MRIGKYEIRGELGRGAMGVVHEAWDPLLERGVALKLISLPQSEDPSARLLFEREAKAIARMSHPNIVTVHEFGYEEGGQPYIVMELLRGSTLRHFVLEKHPPFDQRLEMAAQVADGLAHAHDRQIVHRDIKPANIFVTDAEIVKITDFGIARLIASPKTQGLGVVGTPDFMSPEQIRGETVDGRSDIFSLGIVLYWMIKGEPPFVAPSLAALLYKIAREDAPPLGPIDFEGSAALARIVARALAKDPAERYPTAQELADELRVARHSAALHGGSSTPTGMPLARSAPRGQESWTTPAEGGAAFPPLASWNPKHLLLGVGAVVVLALAARGRSDFFRKDRDPTQDRSPVIAVPSRGDGGRAKGAGSHANPPTTAATAPRPALLTDLSPNSPQALDVGIAVRDERHGWEYPVEQALAEALLAERPSARPRLFTREFVSSGGFNALYAGCAPTTSPATESTA